jgi:predicted ATP-dependent Lon-type protease
LPSEGDDMRDLDEKTTAVFAGKVVRKDLVRKVKVGANVPVFVLEYLWNICSVNTAPPKTPLRLTPGCVS